MVAAVSCCGTGKQVRVDWRLELILQETRVWTSFTFRCSELLEAKPRGAKYKNTPHFSDFLP